MRYFVLTIIAFMILSSCSDETDQVFDKAPQQRIREKSQQYLEILQKPDKGWYAQIKPNNEKIGTYNYYFHFHKNGKVYLSSDADIMEFASVLDSSYYEIRYDKEMTLTFTTFSQMNFFREPGIGDGQEIGGDFELIFKEVSNNSIRFEGKVNQGNYFFVPSETSEYVTTLDQIRGVELNLAFILLDNEYKFPTIVLDNGTNILLDYDWMNRSAELMYMDGNDLVVKSSKVNYTTTHFVLESPIVINGIFLNKLKFNEDEYVFQVDNEGVQGILELRGLPPVSIPGMAEKFANITYGPVTGWSSKAKRLRRDLKDVNDRFTSIQFYNDPNIFHGVAFKFSNPSEWPYIKYANNTVEILGEDKIRFIADGVYNEAEPTVDLNEILQTEEGKALYDAIFSEEGFIVWQEVGARIISVKDPDIWFLVSKYD